MSNAITFARPYARAAFELAHAHNALGDWAQKLAFAAQVAADPAVCALFGNPRIGTRDLASLLLPDGETMDSPFANFIAVLTVNRRLAVLPEIAALYEQLKNEAERTLKVYVRTATLMSDVETGTLKDALKQRFHRDIKIEQSLDTSILGGAVIDAGDVVIDGSVRGRLARLEAAIMQ